MTLHLKILNITLYSRDNEKDILKINIFCRFLPLQTALILNQCHWKPQLRKWKIISSKIETDRNLHYCWADKGFKGRYRCKSGVYISLNGSLREIMLTVSLTWNDSFNAVQGLHNNWNLLHIHHTIIIHIIQLKRPVQLRVI